MKKTMVIAFVSIVVAACTDQGKGTGGGADSAGAEYRMKNDKTIDSVEGKRDSLLKQIEDSLEQ